MQSIIIQLKKKKSDLPAKWREKKPLGLYVWDLCQWFSVLWWFKCSFYISNTRYTNIDHMCCWM